MPVSNRDRHYAFDDQSREFGRFYKFYCSRHRYLLLTRGRAATSTTFNDRPLLFASLLSFPFVGARHRQSDTNLIASNENLMPAEIPTAHFSVPNGLGIRP